MKGADVDSRLDQAGAALLSVRHVRKSFGAVVVAADLSFDVTKGSTLGVLGPNGAGKTTLFNMIAGDVQVDAGEIWLEGERLDPLPAHRRAKRGLSRSYQVPQPFGHMTVFENLLVAAVFGRDVHEKQAHDRCFAVLEDTGLMAKANHRAGSLPLLDRKRLELARALASEPRLLLLDEIAGGLTDDEAGELVELIKREPGKYTYSSAGLASINPCTTPSAWPTPSPAAAKAPCTETSVRVAGNAPRPTKHQLIADPVKHQNSP